MEKNQVLLRQIAIQCSGNGENYQYFKKTIEASPLLYQHDFHFYNDDISTRHQRNIKELQYLKKLLKQKKIQTKMLNDNVLNTFYPSYVLHHHHSIFIPLFLNIPSSSTVQSLVKQARENKIVGAFFRETRRSDLKPSKNVTPQLDENGVIKMDTNTYFYSLVTSPYITHAAFISQRKDTQFLTVIAVRDQSGELNKSIKVLDFGATISNDYIPVGYNFSSVKPCLIVQLPSAKLIYFKTAQLQQRFAEFNYSLKDFQKSLWITTKYTSMRKQFRTIDDSKEERAILTYQTISGRVIDGFAQFIAFTDLYARLLQNSRSYIILSDLLQSSHHIILEHLVTLRECCGGFGYMQFSGHPGCIERVCNRAGSESTKELSLTPEYLRMTHFFESTQELQKYYIQQIKQTNVQFIQYFGIFISICANMRSQRAKLTTQQFRREYLRQASIMAMQGRQQLLRHEATNIHCQLVQYVVSTYILKNARFINWTYIKIDRSLFFEQLNQNIAKLYEVIVKNISDLCSTLELTYLRNVIIGRQNQTQFYEELVSTSKANLRNSKEYAEYVRAPVAEMITHNRAKI